MKEDLTIHFAGIIPARYASSRFPGKPLALIGGKPMIQMVYEQAAASLEEVYVATDDERIFRTVTDFGGRAIMTSTEHRSGTDRCSEALERISNNSSRRPDVIINIQGDEPFIKIEQIELLKNCFTDANVDIATLVRKTTSGEDIFNPNQPKVIINSAGDALYFSRAAIPYVRDSRPEEWSIKHSYYKHIGIYAYRSSVLQSITKLSQSPLELAESLEQNRWLENGFRIRTAETPWENIGIDTPDDLEKANLILKGLK